MKRDVINTKRVLVGIFSVLFLGIMIGCEQDSSDLDTDLKNSGKVIFRITDAPFPSELVAEANITIDRLQLIDDLADEMDEETDSMGEGNPPGLYTIDLAEETTFNLLELSNGITAFLGEADVPAGAYQEIRMHILDAEIVLTDNTVYDLKVPSGNASGLKIKVEPALLVDEGNVFEVILDFDVSRSFVVRGNLNHPQGKDNIQGFIFKPVVRAVPQIVSGNISGVVADTSGTMLQNAMISLLSNTDISDTITTALTTDQGYYAITGIPEGIYSLACSKDSFITQIEENIEVIAGDVTQQDFNLTPVSEE